MDIRKLQRAIVDGLEDVKAQGIQVFDTEHLSSLFERVIIASGTSNRQTKALAASVRDAVKSNGFPVPRTEGEDNGEWIIVDCGAAVVHVMQPSIREYYHLEEIWGGKPVKLTAEKLTKLVKASEDAQDAKPAAKKAPAKKAAAKKAPAKKVPAKTATSKSTAKSTSPKAKAPKAAAPKAPVAKKVMKVGLAPAAKKAPAKKAPARSFVAAKKAPAKKVATGVTRTVGVKAPAAKKAATKTVAAKKAPAKKTTARKTGK